MARRLTVHKVIKSVLHPSYDHESGIEDPSLSLPIGIPYSNDEIRSPPRKREFTTRTFPASTLKSYIYVPLINNSLTIFNIVVGGYLRNFNNACKELIIVLLLIIYYYNNYIYIVIICFGTE